MIKKVWFDITNTPHVHFLLAIEKILAAEISDFKYTARDFSETLQLLSTKVSNRDIIQIDSKYGNNYFSKVLSLHQRYQQIRKSRIDFDLSISCGSDPAIWYSWLKRKKSIAFGDNDTARQWTYGRFVNYALFPDAIPKDILLRQGLKGKLYQYHGYKEDLYISYFTPDEGFKERLPFDEYVVVRPENIHANYLRNGNVRTIVPLLLRLLDKTGLKIVYLPRYEVDHTYARGVKNVFIPKSPLNGLDLCYFSSAVFTGAGTLAREAACLGVPAFSFYAGKDLLAVDRQLIVEGRIVYSRDPEELIKTVIKKNREATDLTSSLTVREEVKQILLSRIRQW